MEVGRIVKSRLTLHAFALICWNNSVRPVLHPRLMSLLLCHRVDESSNNGVLEIERSLRQFATAVGPGELHGGHVLGEKFHNDRLDRVAHFAQ